MFNTNAKVDNENITCFKYDKEVNFAKNSNRLKITIFLKFKNRQFLQKFSSQINNKQ